MRAKTESRTQVCVLTVKCISAKCKTKRDIESGTPEAQEQPFCEKCYRPMIAHSAKTVWR